MLCERPIFVSYLPSPFKDRAIHAYSHLFISGRFIDFAMKRINVFKTTKEKKKNKQKRK